MERLPNPFTPTFGHVPLALAGRQQMLEDVIEGLENAPGDPNRATIFVGPRGSGKTVLLTTLGREAMSRGWISVDISARDGMLNEVIDQIHVKAVHLLSAEPSSRITSLQGGGFGVTFEMLDREPTWRTRVTALVEELNSRGVGVLFTIDEVSPTSEDLRDFVDVYQYFIRDERNVAILLAGLPSRVSSLILAVDITFLRRAFQRELGPIETNEVEQAMLETIEAGGRQIEPEALTYAAEATGGFAYLVQLVGYYLWRQHPADPTITVADARLATRQALREMERVVFVPTLRELSPRERDYLQAMASANGSIATAAVAESMGISTKNASNVRRRLIERGIIAESGRGSVDFEMPMLREYLRGSY